MKTIFTLLTSLILSIAVSAAPIDVARPKSMLTIRSMDRGDIRVVIDGRRFEPGDNYMRIQSLDAGLHTIKVYKERTTGLFSIWGKKYEVVFNKSIGMKPFTNVLITVDRFGRAQVSETRVNMPRGRDDRYSGFQDDGNWDRNHDFDYDRGNNFGDYDSRDSKWGGRTGGNDDRGYNDNSFNKAMSDLEFQRVLASMNREWYENNKAKSASQIISSSFLTSAQVKQMLQSFSMENLKLDLAKQAYAKTVDQRNYFMINDVFSFSSSKDDLARYIRSH